MIFLFQNCDLEKQMIVILQVKKKSNELDTPTLVTLVNFRNGKHDRSVYLQNCHVLINIGALHSLCTNGCVKQNEHKWKRKKNSFNTGAREMKTAYKTKVAFSVSEFSESKIIEWRFNVCKSKKELGCDMIIGRDLLKQLGMVLDFQKKMIELDLITISMQDYAKLRKFSGKEINKIIQSTKEPIVMQKATDRIVKILDSNYHKADLQQVVAKATHLSDSKRDKLYDLLLQYKDLFDRTLGK